MVTTRYRRYAMVAILLSTCACSTTDIHRTLYSLGEQTDCAQRYANRLDGDAERAKCLANATMASEFETFAKSRKETLNKRGS